MTLQVRFVQNLSQIVDPVADFLSRDIESLDLFEQQHVIVPTAGVRAWLVPQLARQLGATAGRGDGIVSNVRFGYVGALNAFLRNGVDDDNDAWSIDHLTMAVLQVVSNEAEYEWLVKKYGGRLRAARAIADRFDRYAARRPHMIRAWERGTMMIPGVNIADADEAKRFSWQFELWTRVRSIIGVPSWPARSEQLIAQLSSGVAIDGLPRRLMVAGLESISASNLEVLIALGKVIDVDALFVHPSPALREEWSKLENQYRTETGDIPPRVEDFFTDGADVLVSTWARGSFELQMLLASQGISATHGDVSATLRALQSESASNHLLSRMQRTISDPAVLETSPVEKLDVSVRIHRAHNLARQVEILHDALLHAFTELPDLQPHDVLVLCADIEAAAPLLQAMFDRDVTLANGRSIKVPFVVADRSLRDVSAGAELLGDILALATSRFDVNSVMKVAASKLVLDNFGLTDSDVGVWMRHSELTRVRWGIDPEQRAVKGLDAPTITAHTWQHLLERALLGALVPNAPAAFELGNVVPLTHVDVADIVPISGLVGILSSLVALEHISRRSQPVSVWCDILERTLIGLCGESCIGIDDALEVLSQFQRATVLVRPDGSVHFDDVVNFDEFADLISHLLVTSPGRQPLRTGAVTATSFVPLRSVPFRVMCVVGLDDGTLPSGDAEGDDLVAIQPLMGDSDSRLETRRVLLDAVLAAQERLIITCIGRSIKNNSPVPLVTPLAELVDFAGRLGVKAPSEPENLSGIESLHPRHQSGVRNFVDGAEAVIPGIVWSHDVAARNAAEKLNGAVESTSAPVGTLAEKISSIPLKYLEDLIIDPLGYYLERTLKIFDDYDNGDDAATLPTSVDKFGIADAAEALDEMLGVAPLDQVRVQWRTSMSSTEILPVAPFVDDALAVAEAVAVSVHRAREAAGLKNLRAEEVQHHVGGGFVVEGTIDGVCDATKTVSIIRHHEYADKDQIRLAVRLLVLCATGSSVRRGIAIHRTSKDSTNATVRTILLNESVDEDSAKKALRNLLEVEAIARTIPCPLFGDTAMKLFFDQANDDEVSEAFDAELESFGFKKSKEFLVYGGSPDLKDVYETRRTTFEKFFKGYFGFMQLDAVEGTTNTKAVSH